MGRTAYDFNRYGAQDLRRYLGSFELPRPDECDPREILLTLPRAEALSRVTKTGIWPPDTRLGVD